METRKIADSRSEQIKEEEEQRRKWLEKPRLGMTAEEVLATEWGKPREINKTTYTFGTREQWCYSGYRYVYFEDEIVTAISE